MWKCKKCGGNNIKQYNEEDVHELMVFGITIIKSDTYKSWNDRYDSQSKEFKE